MDPDNNANVAHNPKFWPVLWIYYMVFGILACKTTAHIGYFQDIPDTLVTKTQTLPTSKFSPPVIHPGDILHVTIHTNDNTLVSHADNQITPGLTLSVDTNGNIEIPVLGKILAEGCTISQLRDTLSVRASKFYKSPVIAVRLSNFTITVLGEVAKPGNFISSNEKVSVLDALGMAGDMSIYGKKENVLVIREQDNHKQAIRLNLNSTTSLTSPYFYLKQGDVVIVEPNKNKIAAARDSGKTRNYALIASGLSVLIIFISRLTF
jgi:polysaccharide export outer membrane protein